jgi:hypothetical protein
MGLTPSQSATVAVPHRAAQWASYDYQTANMFQTFSLVVETFEVTSNIAHVTFFHM